MQGIGAFLLHDGLSGFLIMTRGSRTFKQAEKYSFQTGRRGY